MNLARQNQLGARYWTEFDEQGERLVIPIRRNWKTIAGGFGLLILYGFQHAVQLRDRDWISFLMLTFIALATLLFLGEALTSLLGRETIQVSGGKLRHGWRLFGFGRTKEYEVGSIRLLAADRDLTKPDPKKLVSALRDFGKIGSIAFDYGDKTVFMGATLEPGEAQPVVDWLTRRLPKTAPEFG
jgi:hypothetical protein